MPTDTPPFNEISHRLRRSVDDKLAALLNGEKAVARLVGPRRIGKTELVSTYARETEAPILCVTIQPIPRDLGAGPVVLAILEREIDGLVHSGSKLGTAVEKMANDRNKHETKREIKAKFTIPGDFGSLSAKAEKKRTIKAAGVGQADTEIAASLRRLELAAMATNTRPIVFFDEIQELLVNDDAGMPTVWVIRNEAQHHTSCRYVFAGSNQRLFAKLQDGRQAPLLNWGSELGIPPLTTAEIDAWAVPLFRKGGRHISTLASATGLLAGKIGEVAEVCTRLWLDSKMDDVLDEAVQQAAVRAVARQQTTLGRQTSDLTHYQMKVLRWIVMNPNVSPYTKPAKAFLDLNDGTVAT
ncbi:MAG TPA: hypothetical protein VN829_06600, partial [Dongiaceae bacterium]|nr:hypothetical protein [Dongiaceae bacterium]